MEYNNTLFVRPGNDSADRHLQHDRNKTLNIRSRDGTSDIYSIVGSRGGFGGPDPPFDYQKNPLQLHDNSEKGIAKKQHKGQNCRLLRTNSLVAIRRVQTLI